MRTRSLPILLLLLGACGDDAPDETDPPDADTDTDTDVDTDTDADTDTDTTGLPGTQTKLRMVHVATGYGPVDVFVNGSNKILDDLALYGGTAWSSRPSGTFDFQLTTGVGGNPAAPLATLSAATLNVGEHNTLIAYTGIGGALSVLHVVDDPVGIAPTDQRIRWTNVAGAFASLDVVDVDSGAVLVDDLAFGATVVIDVPIGPMTVGLDLDGDGAVEHTFQGFDLSKSAGPGTMVDLQVVSEAGVPVLIAFQPTGAVARRDVVDPGTPMDTGATDTGP